MTKELAPIQPEIVGNTPSAPELKPAQRRAVLALIEHPTIAAAAKAVQKSERTLYRWLRSPLFRRCLNEVLATREMGLEIQALNAAGKAFDALSHLASHRHTEAKSRVNAAKHILEYTDRQIARRK